MQTNKISSIPNSQKNKLHIQKYCTLALLSSLAFLSVIFLKIPFSGFLSLEPKDAIIVISSFIYGPVSGIIMSVVVSLIEMFTISSTGPIGLIMNIISTVVFMLPATLFYKKNTSIKNIFFGLVIGTFFMVGAMILWNYLITPLYMGIPRETVIQMLIPIFLPFNLLKGGINVLFVMLLLPIINVLKKSKLISTTNNSDTKIKKRNLSIIVFSSLFVLSCVLYALVLNGTL